MALYVQKFGGTSLGSLARIEAVAERIEAFRREGHDIVVVVSAMAGETNRLLDLAMCIDPDASRREQDVLLSTGEQVSIALLTMALQKRGCDAISMTGDQAGIKTDARFSQARILTCDTTAIQKQISLGRVVVVAGFQGRDSDGSITTLGRGGSDLTAVALAAALRADECQIFTDVDGVYTTDPRIEPRARRLTHINFEEMLEMSTLGAKVLQRRSVELAGQYRVPLRVLSSFDCGYGTLVSYGLEEGQVAPCVAGIAFSNELASISVQGLGDDSQATAQILEPLSEHGIGLDMLVQSGSSEHGELTFTVDKKDYPRALMLTQHRVADNPALQFSCHERMARVSLVGLGMKHRPSIVKRIYQLLGEQGIKLQLVSSLEIRISVVIPLEQLQLAVQTLHSGFYLDNAAQPPLESLLCSA